MGNVEYRAKVGDCDLVAHPMDVLTNRQTEATLWTGAGKTTDMVAGVMGCSESTAKSHIEEAMRRLHAVNRAHLIVSAFSVGILVVEKGVLECSWWVFVIAMAWALYLTTVAPPDDMRRTRRPGTQICRVVRIRERSNFKGLVVV